MGYTTDFEGKFKLSRTATAAEIAYINAFNATRRLARTDQIGEYADPLREAVGLPLGKEGEFFVGDEDARANFGQNSVAVADQNRPPVTQPGLWCKWELSEDGNYLQWDECEKFYDYIEWLTYLIDNFFSKWGIVLNGEVKWFGEERSDVGTIVVIDNMVSTQ